MGYLIHLSSTIYDYKMHWSIQECWANVELCRLQCFMRKIIFLQQMTQLNHDPPCFASTGRSKMEVGLSVAQIYDRRVFIRLGIGVAPQLSGFICAYLLPPPVRVSSTPSTLLSFIVKFGLFLSYEKNQNKQKRPGLAHSFFKKYFGLPDVSKHFWQF